MLGIASVASGCLSRCPCRRPGSRKPDERNRLNVRPRFVQLVKEAIFSLNAVKPIPPSILICVKMTVPSQLIAEQFLGLPGLVFPQGEKY